MGIQLQEESTGGLPNVKYRNIGEGVKGAIVAIDTYQVTNMDTNEPEINDKTGRPKEQDRITIIVTEATGGITAGNKKDGTAPIQVGDIVTVYNKGYSRFSYYEAKGDHGAVNVGDIFGKSFDGEEPAGNFMKKLLNVTLEKNDDVALVARAEAEHMERNRPAPTELQGAPVYDEEPF